ncbi:MAG: hypothetical protein Q8K24_09440 [Hydrogenophaga sp.]|nr:hypothetical protein [Hydrogenophaga sp.]
MNASMVGSPPVVLMRTKPVKVGRDISVEFEQWKTGIEGVFRVQVIWDPLPSPREMRRCLSRPSYARALAEFTAKAKEACDAGRG